MQPVFDNSTEPDEPNLGWNKLTLNITFIMRPLILTSSSGTVKILTLLLICVGFSKIYIVFLKFALKFTHYNQYLLTHKAT